MPLPPAETIRAKRDGRALSTAQIDDFVAGLVAPAGSAARWCDAQVGALAMAVVLRGMGRAESTLLQARDALLADQLKWADLAASVGFADQAHLSREFRRITGLSPRELSALLTQESYWMYQIWT